MPIHTTAIIDRSAEIDPSAEVGAYAIIEAGVRIASGAVIHPHAFIGRGTSLGERVQVHPFATVGHHPQDLAWQQVPSYTEIGPETIIREGASVHRGTKPESTTRLGRNVFVMACAHVAHNCVVGDEAILVNGVLLAGYVEAGAKAFFGGGVGVHQFARIGELAMIRGHAEVTMDVAPFMMVGPQGVVGPNTVGLRRAGFSPEQRQELRALYHAIFRARGGFRHAVEAAAAQAKTDPGRRLIEFLSAPSRRGFVGYARGRASRLRGDDEG
jgi:UDP-N-acetylglucosamine acyltransferase